MFIVLETLMIAPSVSKSLANFSAQGKLVVKKNLMLELVYDLKIS
jgi:hypothetical protein